MTHMERADAFGDLSLSILPDVKWPAVSGKRAATTPCARRYLTGLTSRDTSSDVSSPVRVSIGDDPSG